MSALQNDLFGEEFAVQHSPVKHQTKDVERKKPAKLVINRRALWSSSGYLAGIHEVDDDDEVEDVTSTANTYSDNSTLERLERALGMVPVIKDGVWQTDILGFQYRLRGTPFKGERTMGAKASMLRELNRLCVLETARNALEGAYTDPCAWIVLNSVAVLHRRLRMMDENEDPYACLQAFLQVMLQHDFIDNARKGETIRNLTKRDFERERRAAKKKAKEEKVKVSDELMSSLESEDFDQ